jgi:hypothetical protein
MFGNLFQKTLTPERFAEAFAKRLKQYPGVSAVDHEAAESQLRFQFHGGNQLIRLQNAYAEAQKAPPAKQDAIIDFFIKAQLESARPDDDLEANRRNLLPTVQAPSYFSISELTVQANFPDAKPVHIPYGGLAPGLAVGIVIDSERAKAAMTHDKFHQWGLSLEQALGIAIDNLRDSTEAKFKEETSGLFVSQWNDTYDATRMLLTDMLCRLKIRGEPVVGIPNRNRLIVAGSKDPEALVKVANTVAYCIENEPRPNYAGLLRLDQGRWLPFDEASLPNHALLVRAHYQILIADYNQQKELLDKLHQAGGHDIHVASYMVKQGPDGAGPFSAATLTRGVRTLLPRVDRLMLLDSQTRELIMVPWEAAAEALGSRLAPLKLAPPRFEASEFPNVAQLDVLRSKALLVRQI